MNAKMLLLFALVPMLPVAAQQSASTPDAAALRRVLNALTPGAVTVTGVKIEGMQATVSGISSEHSQVNDFLRNIESSPVLDAPLLQQVMPVDGNSEFVFTTVVQCPTALDAAVNPCVGGTRLGPSTVHKCTVDGVVTFQSAPCPGD